LPGSFCRIWARPAAFALRRLTAIDRKTKLNQSIERRRRLGAALASWSVGQNAPGRQNDAGHLERNQHA
jgi:hypothetical protein